MPRTATNFKGNQKGMVIGALIILGYSCQEHPIVAVKEQVSLSHRKWK